MLHNSGHLVSPKCTSTISIHKFILLYKQKMKEKSEKYETSFVSNFRWFWFTRGSKG